MDKQSQPQPSAEVLELKRLLDDAARSSPELWAAIQQSITAAELATYSYQAQTEQGSKISSGTETSTLYPMKESE